MTGIKHIILEETDSTNRFLREYRGEEGERITVVRTDYQKAGRGQGSNSWESERGKNLTFSMKTYPKGVPANRQYVMLEAGALAIHDVLQGMTDGISIKWPNDIYCKDRKISGTLSECSVTSDGVRWCILGVGLNVNQEIFTSDAPNPVSLKNILGKETDKETLLNAIIRRFIEYHDMIDSGELDNIDMLYMNALYHKDGIHEYEDADGRFRAEIVRVEKNGHLVLRTASGDIRSYAFKEVKFII